MALLFFDGFESYGSSANMAPTWVTGAGTVVATGGRRSSGGWQNGLSGSSGVKITITANPLVVGVAIKSGTFYDRSWVRVYNSTSSEQISVRSDAAGYLYISRNGTTLWSGAGDSRYLLSTTVFRYIEFKVTVNPVAGGFTLRVGGDPSTDVTQTSINTAAQGTSDVSYVFLGTAGTGVAGTYDDFYICDLTGTIANDFLGDVRVDVLRPAAEGAHADFTPSAGTDNSLLVDDTSPSMTDYVSSNALNAVDTYVTTGVPYTPAIVYGVKPCAFVQTDTAGLRKISPVSRISAADYVGSEVQVSTTAQTLEWVLPTNPATGNPWTKAEIDAAEFGIKITT